MKCCSTGPPLHPPPLNNNSISYLSVIIFSLRIDSEANYNCFSFVFFLSLRFKESIIQELQLTTVCKLTIIVLVLYSFSLSLRGKESIIQEL